MTDAPAGFVHEYLRRLDAKLDRLIDGFQSISVRLAAVEQRLTLLDQSVVNTHVRIDSLQQQVDGFDNRLARIESRLGLVDA